MSSTTRCCRPTPRARSKARGFPTSTSWLRPRARRSRASTAARGYRGTADVVVERLPLENLRNRIPQLSFEIIRPIGRLEPMIRAVTLIPGTTEFGYEPATIVQVAGPGQFAPENRHVADAVSDIEAALDDLRAVCPNLERVAVAVAWFGND